MVWSDNSRWQSGSKPFDVMAVSIGPDGAILQQPVTVAQGDYTVESDTSLQNPRVAFGNGKYLILWEKRTCSYISFPAFCSNTAAGALAPSDFPATSATQQISLPVVNERLSVAFDGNRFFVVGVSSSGCQRVVTDGSYNCDISGMFVDESGVVSATVAIVSTARLSSNAATSVAFNPSGYSQSPSGSYLVVWGNNEIRAAIVGVDGVILNPSFVVGGTDTTSSEIESYPSVVFDGVHYFVVWVTAHSWNGFTYLYRLDGVRMLADGTPLDTRGIPVSSGSTVQQPAQLVGKANGKFDMLVVWPDSRNGTSGAFTDIFGVITHAATPVAQPIVPPTPPPAQPIPGVDLSVGGFAMVPVILKAGTPISIESTIRNDGTQAAGPFEARYHWSSSLPVTDGTVLYTQTFPSGLGAGASLKQSFAVTPPLGADGTYYLGVVVDATIPDQVAEANEQNNTSVFALTVDTTPPATAVLYPRSTDVVRGPVPVLVSAEDSTGVLFVEFYLDGVRAFVDIGGPSDGWEWRWDTSTATNGSHTLSAKAFDAAGNIGISANMSVQVDNATPLISSIYVNGITTTGATITWTTDEPADSQVEYGTTSAYGNLTPLAPTLVNSHSVSLTGLAASTQYYYRVTSRDAAGNPASSAGLTFTTPPVAPTNLTATAPTSTQVVLTWTGSGGPISVAGYRIERCQGTGCTTFAELTTQWTSQGFTTPWTSYSDAALAPGTSYRYRVRAIDAFGNLSDYSAVVTAVTPVPATAPPPVGWVARYNGPANGDDSANGRGKVVTDSANNVYVTGWSWNGTTADIATLKYDAAGAQQWVARSSTGSTDPYWVFSGWPLRLVPDGSGNLYVVGVICHDAACSNVDIATLKYNGAGALQWMARYDNGGLDYSLSAAVDSAGNVFVTGVSANGVNTDAVTIAYGPGGGAPLWVARYDAGGNDEGAGVAVDGAGNVYMTGGSCANAACTNDNWDAVTIKYSSTGAVVWTARYDNGNHDYTAGIGLDGSGNVYVGGHSCKLATFPPGYYYCPDFDYLAIKYDPAGTRLWVARYDNGGNDYAGGGLAVDAAGNAYLTGSSWNGINDDAATVKVSPTGQVLWAARYDHGGAEDKAGGIAFDRLGNILVSGYSSGPSGLPDYAVVSYAPDGAERWVVRYDGGGSDIGFSLAVDSVGNVLVTGESSAVNADYATIQYVQDQAPPIISAVVAGSITASGATITWTTDEVADTQVEYGTTTSYGSSTTLDTTLVTSHSAALSGLSASTLYHYRVKSRDAAGNLATSADYTFTTAAVLPPVVDSVSTKTGNGTSVTWSHTVSGSGTNRLLVVGVSHRTANSAATVTGVTYAGLPLTRVGMATQTNVRVHLWYLINPPTGTNSVVVALSNQEKMVAAAVSLTGVRQSAPLGTFTSSIGNSTSPSVAVSSATGDVVLDVMGAQGTSTATVGPGQTQRWNTVTTGNSANSNVRGTGSTEPGASTVSMSWTLGAAQYWAIGAVPIRPAGAQ